MTVILSFIVMNDQGTYRVDGDKIYFEGKSRRTMGFRFEDGYLILTEPGDTFKLRRVGGAR